MKNILPVLIVFLGLTLEAQVVSTVPCDQMGLSVNVSDTNMVSLYHPGHYLTWPRTSNVIEWIISDQQGNVIAQDILIDEQSFTFSFDIPLTDTLLISAQLVNDSAIHEGNPVNCLIEDALYWKEDVFPSGTPYGRWTFVYESVGVDQNPVGIDPIDIDRKPVLIKVIDYLGRESKESNQPLIYIYDDGRVEQKVVFE
ncbi:MAG: hypothetical protein ACON48_05830 [Chitinophagales bacterium]